MPQPLDPTLYGKYAAAHGNRDYYADVGVKAIFVHKRTMLGDADEWVMWVMIGDATQNLNGHWEASIKSHGGDPFGGALADGQTDILFEPETFFTHFTISIKEPVNSKTPKAGFAVHNLRFELFQSEETNSAYAAPPSTDKKTGTPIPYSEDMFSPGVAKKLVGDFNATDSSSNSTTTNTPLLLGVGLLVVAVGFYGMRR